MTTTHTRQPRRVRQPARLVASAALAIAIASALFGQGQVGSGHALDGSLEVGSYGFNGYSGRPSSLSMRNYAP